MVKVLFKNNYETVTIEKLLPGSSLFTNARGGTELLVISGRVEVEQTSYEAESWLRFPHLDNREINSSSGAEIWIKRGHLL